MIHQRDLFTGEPIEASNRRAPKPPTKRGPAPAEELAELKAIVAELAQRIVGLEGVVAELRDLVLARRTVKDSYSTQEVATLLEKSAYTVREWCRLQRVHARKTMSGRGCEEEWRIDHEELMRIQNEGLLPIPEHY